MKKLVMLSVILAALLVSCVTNNGHQQSVPANTAGVAGMVVETAGFAGVAGSINIAGAAGSNSTAGTSY